MNVGSRGYPISHAELAEVVVQVFVHAAAPGLRRKRTKEGMRMPCALPFPALMKLAQLEFQLFLLASKIAGIGDDQLFVGGVVLGERLLVGEDGPDEWADQ